MLRENELSGTVVSCCIEVHQILGPGLLESVYEQALELELVSRKIQCARQVPIPVHYADLVFECGFRIDVMVEDILVVEIKSVELILPVHKKQLLTYLKLSKKKIGLLINFKEELLKNGITRMVNGL